MKTVKISSFRCNKSIPTGFLEMKSNPFWEVRHVGMTLNFSPVVKVVVSVALFCVLQTTGLPNSAPNNNPYYQFHQYHHPNVTHQPHHPYQMIPSSSSDLITQSSHVDPLLHDQPFRLDPLPDEEEDTYDPVEAYHQLRRHYLTSTSRVDRVHYGIGGGGGGGGWDSSSASSSPSVKTRHHSHIQSNYHQHPNNHHHQDPLSPPSGSSKSSDRDNNNRNDNGRSYGQIKGESAHYHHSHLPHKDGQQRCYVCLPPNKSSREAKDILGMFGKQNPGDIADCAEFTQANANAYEFNCPPGFGGCILRIHGMNVSRACSKYKLNDCKKANSVEFCYCTEPLCNDVKPPPLPLYASGEDDDEDGYGGGSGERSTKEEEAPSDSELVHTSNKNNNNKDSSVALANFNDNDDNNKVSSRDQDVRSLTNGDELNLNSSATANRNKISGIRDIISCLVPTLLLLLLGMMFESSLITYGEESVEMRSTTLLYLHFS